MLKWGCSRLTPFPCNHTHNHFLLPISFISSPSLPIRLTRTITSNQNSNYIPLLSYTDRLAVRAHSVSSTSPAPTMVKAIRVHQLGGPEVLKWEDVEMGEPKDGEIRVKNKAIGLNFIDVYFRKGVYKAPAFPFTPGMEAVGVVTAVGPGLTGRKVGDIVAYAGSPMGSYAEEQILPADRVVPVPPSIDPIVAASILLKGMTAQFLLRRCFKGSLGVTGKAAAILKEVPGSSRGNSLL